MDYNDKTKVYFIYDIKTKSIIAHTTHKEYAELFIDQRDPKLVRYRIVKVKKRDFDEYLNTQYMKSALILDVVYNDTPMLVDEIECMFEGINDYINDLSSIFRKFLSKIDLIKFTDKEKKYIEPFIELIGIIYNNTAVYAEDGVALDYFMDICDMDIVSMFYIELHGGIKSCQHDVTSFIKINDFLKDIPTT